VSTYVFMKVLESAPHRYDLGIRLLSRGGIERVHEIIAERVAAPGKRLLDIGCGTGGLALACAARGAHVVGIDVNPDMLDVARAKAQTDPPDGHVEWVRLGAMEIEDRFPPGTLDAVVSSLLFSELTAAERAYVLRTAHSILRPAGTLAIADEMSPRGLTAKLWSSVLRLPVAALTYVLTQATTRPLEGLELQMSECGFRDIEAVRVHPGALTIVFGERPREET
jgi:ubiquinone/menaquinone biosynthesis C-methylase UbiE